MTNRMATLRRGNTRLRGPAAAAKEIRSGATDYRDQGWQSNPIPSGAPYGTSARPRSDTFKMIKRSGGINAGKINFITLVMPTATENRRDGPQDG